MKLAVAFTGQDGTGKSSLIALLEARLVAIGCSTRVVHQYGPTTWLGRRVGPWAKRIANRLRRRRSGPVARTHGPGRVGPARGGVVSFSLAATSLVVGWARARGNWRRGRHVDVLILDRCYCDELIRAGHQFGTVPRFGWWLLRRGLPRPDLAFTFTVDPRVGYERKKTRELSFDEYAGKTAVAREIVLRAGETWDIVSIAIDGRDARTVFGEIWPQVEERVDAVR